MTVSNEASLARPIIAQHRATPTRWTDVWSPTTISRAAGICALAQVAIMFVPTNVDLHSDSPTSQILTWMGHNQQALWTDGFLTSISSTLLALQIVLLASLVIRGGLLASIARVGAAAGLATGWVRGGVEYAIADLAHRGSAPAGVLALVSLGKTMDYADGVAFGLAIGSVSFLLLRTRALPRLVIWLGFLAAAQLLVTMPIQLAVMGTGNGPQGPISVVVGLLWLVVTGITLLVKPVRVFAPAYEGSEATA